MLTIFVVTHALYGFSRAAFPEGEVRMDDDYQYFNSQDIIKAFSKSKPPWYYGHNVEDRDMYGDSTLEMFTVKTTCTYFTKENLDDKNVNFTKYYKDEEEKRENEQTKQEKGKEEEKQKMKSKPLYGTFFTTPLIENNTPKERTTPNGITVSSSPGGSPEVGYKLIYSNYDNCHIIRPFPLDKVKDLPSTLPPNALATHVKGLSYYEPGASIYESTKSVCVVLLADTQARKGRLPNGCNAVYKSMCGTRRDLKRVFGEQCPHIPNALGC